MITSIPATQFKTIPWKNGLGHTTELAINDGGNLDCFDWRLSIASVTNDGEFSNFSGYQRNLVLIEGKGLKLDHNNGQVDELDKLLDIARFDGACQTVGSLSHGAIKDFNVISNQEKINADVQSYLVCQQVIVKLSQTSLCFAYSLTDDISIENVGKEKTTIAVGNLVKISAIKSELKDEQLPFTLTGKNMIVIKFTPK